jgi:hypothetical protein
VVKPKSNPALVRRWRLRHEQYLHDVAALRSEAETAVHVHDDWFDAIEVCERGGDGRRYGSGSHARRRRSKRPGDGGEGLNSWLVQTRRAILNKIRPEPPRELRAASLAMSPARRPPVNKFTRRRVWGVVRLPIGGCWWPKTATLEVMQQTQYRRRHAMCEMQYREPHDADWR